MGEGNFINDKEIKNVRKELLRRKRLLIKFSKDKSIPMDALDRECISLFFEKEKHPTRPQNVSHLMRIFFTSYFSYAPLRRYLTSVAGSIPDSSILPSCLAKIFSEEKFSKKDSWSPAFLHELASSIQIKRNYDLKSKKFKPRMISVLLSGSDKMAVKLKNGIDNFYNELNSINNGTGDQIWQYVSSFSKDIYNVGPNLICDFIKGIGFERFVKVDHHFKKEFPQLLGLDECNRLSNKEHFILSQQLADLIQMSPFHLDHLLYQWGRYKKYGSKPKSDS